MIQHKESSTKIFFTKSYDLFMNVAGNRKLNHTKIRNIKKDIMNGLDILRWVPVLVIEENDKLLVIDGQHRVEICKALKCPVWYVIAENLTIQDIAKINSNTERWKTDDYINCYASQNNEHYDKLSKFMADTGFPLSVSQRLLATGEITFTGGLDANQSAAFKKGLFEVKHEEAANRFVQAARQFEDFQGWNSRLFLIALETVIKAGKADFMDLIDKYKTKNVELKKCDSVKAYLGNLEEIYNFKARERRFLY